MKNFKNDKLYSLVFNEIKSYIIDKPLGPGDKLPTEMEMCEKMGVSRNVLREALKSLQMMGIIKSIPGNGNVIQEFKMDFIFENVFYYLIPDDEELVTELRQIRSILEMNFLKEAFFSVAENDIVEMEQLIKAIEEKTYKGERYNEEDYKFHMLLFKNVKNKTLLSFFKAAWIVSRDLSKVKLYKSSPTFSMENHKAIFMAIKERNYEEAKKQMLLHFELHSDKDLLFTDTN